MTHCRENTEEEKRPIIQINNLWCAFCGRQSFFYEPYSFTCTNCKGKLIRENYEWRYSYPSGEVFERQWAEGTEWYKSSTGWWAPKVLYNILNGHKLPDYDEINRLEKEIENNNKIVSKLRDKIRRLKSV